MAKNIRKLMDIIKQKHFKKEKNLFLSPAQLNKIAFQFLYYIALSSTFYF